MYRYFHRILLILLLNISSVQAETVRIAVATNFTDPMKKIAQSFEEDTGHQIKLSFASSGKLFAQIKYGAPFDIFLSADTNKPKALVTQRLAVANSRFTYAFGRLVLWAPHQHLKPSNIKRHLNTQPFSHLAIANAKLAPYGYAALQTLENLDVLAAVKPKLVQSENIGQAYQFIYSGNAQLGFIAHSQLIKTKNINASNYWLIPSTLHDPIQQDAVLLHQGQHNNAAIDFMHYLRSEKAKNIIQASGYAVTGV